MRVRLWQIVTVVLLATGVHSDSHGSGLVEGKPKPTQEYPRHEVLWKDKYYLYWGIKDDHVTFEVHVKTLGWVGFGLSTTGGMAGADIVVGLIRDGNTRFADFYGTGQWQPIMDDIQNYELKHSEEMEGFTILKFSRKLDTCDDQDQKIDPLGEISAIFSWNDDDSSFMFHGANKGVKTIKFREDDDQKPILDESKLKTFDIAKTNVAVPNKETYYHCNFVELPRMTQKHHLVKFSPMIEEKNLNVVHHFLVYKCKGPMKPAGVAGYDCNDGPVRKAIMSNGTSCDELIYAWGLGQEDFYLPEKAGISMGESGDGTFWLYDVHYNNPQLRSDIVDSSVVRISYTDETRPHDVGLLVLGHAVAPQPTMVIPPGLKEYSVNSYCGSDCLASPESKFPVDGIWAFASVLHTHELGTGVWTRHIRDEKELKPIVVEKNYDDEYQKVILFPEEVNIRSGDSFQTTCVYNSMDRKNVTLGGLGGREEMCINFLYHYPRMNLGGCTSNVHTFDNVFPLILARAKMGWFGEEYRNMSRAAHLYWSFGFLPYMVWDQAAKDYFINLDKDEKYLQFCATGDSSPFGGDNIYMTEKQVIREPYRDECGRMPLKPTSGARDTCVTYVTMATILMMMMMPLLM